MTARLVALTLFLAVAASCSNESDDEGSDGSAGSAGSGGLQNVFVDGIRGSGGCLPRPLAASDEGRVPCAIVEARSGSPCSCDAPGRIEVSSSSVLQSSIRYVEQTQSCGGASGVDCAALCFCEIEQFSGAELDRCQNDVDTGDLVGFCYVDADQMIGNPELVADCPASSRRQLRFLDPSGNTPQAGSTTMLACEGASL